MTPASAELRIANRVLVNQFTFGFTNDASIGRLVAAMDRAYAYIWWRSRCHYVDVLARSFTRRARPCLPEADVSRRAAYSRAAQDFS